jgi:RimJ/RimL family protein N-acetyltransferase
MENGDASFTVLETPRLILRRFHPIDLQDFSKYRSHPEVALYQSWVTFTLDDAKKLFEEMKNSNPGIPGKWFQFAIEEKSSHQLIGDCGLKIRADDSEQAEIGFTLSKDFQGKGFGSEAVSKLLGYIFENLKKHRVTALTDAKNVASQNLLERVGFRKEAHYVNNTFFKGEWGSECLFAILADEWKK